jgi:hypothetical protein
MVGTCPAFRSEVVEAVAALEEDAVGAGLEVERLAVPPAATSAVLWRGLCQ